MRKSIFLFSMVALAMLSAACAVDILTEQTVAQIMYLEDARLLSDSELGIDLLKMSKSSNAEIRARVCLALGRIGLLPNQQGMEDALIARLADDNIAVRRAAAFAVGVADIKAAKSVLLGTMRDADVELRQLAGEAFAKLAGSEDGETLVQAIKEEQNEEVKRQLILSSYRLHHRGLALHAKKLLLEGAGNLDLAAAWHLMRNEKNGQIPWTYQELEKLVAHPQVMVRKAAVKMISILPENEEYLPLIVSLLADPELPVRSGAVNLMGRLDPAKALEAITKASKSELNQERQMAAAQAGALIMAFAEDENAAGIDSIFPVLLPLLDDSEVAVVATAIGSMTNAAHRSPLLSMLDELLADPRPEVRAAAVHSAFKLEDDLLARAEVAMADEAVMVQMAAYGELVGSELPWAEEKIAGLLEQDDEALINVAVRRYSSRPSDEGLVKIVALYERFKDKESTEVVSSILGALRAYEDSDEAKAIINSAMSSNNRNIRLQATEMLVDLEGPLALVDAGPAVTGRDLQYYLDLLAKVKQTKGIVISTTKGDIEMEFYGEEAPMTVYNIITLAEKGYFDDTRIHRVVPDFVSQMGCPLGTGWGGPGYEIRCEINRLRYLPGAVGMALSGKDTGGSQFFVTLSPQPHLDGGYTIFADVTAGMDVANNLLAGDKIISVSVVE
jgi:cyclophilin family peptidyl-prolyl cis-trans isomerase/HEAT repeat protein